MLSCDLLSYDPSSWLCVAVRTHSPVAVTAFEWLCSSVLPEVSGKLIAPCKAPFTAFPWTPVGLLTCKWIWMLLSGDVHFDRLSTDIQVLYDLWPHTVSLWPLNQCARMLLKDFTRANVSENMRLHSRCEVDWSDCCRLMRKTSLWVLRATATLRSCLSRRLM